MSLTSYRTAPPRGGCWLSVVGYQLSDWASETGWVISGLKREKRVWLGGGHIWSGGDLLSHVLRRSTIGATGLNGRVRDGIGCFPRAVATRPRERMRVASALWVWFSCPCGVCGLCPCRSFQASRLHLPAPPPRPTTKPTGWVHAWWLGGEEGREGGAPNGSASCFWNRRRRLKQSQPGQCPRSRVYLSKPALTD